MQKDYIKKLKVQSNKYRKMVDETLLVEMQLIWKIFRIQKRIRNDGNVMNII